MKSQDLRRGGFVLLCFGLAAFTLRCGGGGSGSSSPPSGGGGTVTLSSLQPIVQMQNSQPFTLALNGSGFSSGDQVVFNGNTLSSAVVSSSQLTATIPSSAVSSPGTALVKVQSGSASSSSLSFYIVPAISEVPVTVTAGSTTSNVNIAAPAFNPPQLLLEALGASTSGTATTAANGAVTVSPGQTVNLFVVGTGVTAGTFFEVTGNNDITVTQPGASDFTQTTDVPPIPAVNFNINVSSSATAGPRNLIVTNPAGEISIVTGGIIVQ
ncbi:MAG: hypothetical protein ACRD22_13530 [Terriglobia bacterium]